MKSGTSLQGIAWAPSGANPKLTAVLVPWPLIAKGTLSRETYKRLVASRLEEGLARLGESDARALATELAASRPELEPLTEIPIEEWPSYLTTETDSLVGTLWTTVGEQKWPATLPKKDDPSARHALENVGARELLTRLVPTSKSEP